MKNFLLIVLAILIGLQFVPSNITNPKTDKDLEIKVSDEIKSIFKRSCYDCHSNEVIIPWYSKIAPASLFINGHVDLGRKWLNFSTWENYNEKEKDDKLKEIFRTVYAAMPLPSYILLHKDAKLTKDEIKLIRDWTGKAPF
jgi:hypothetical protein